MSKLLKVGKIVNTHGVRGEMKVIPLTDDPYRFNDLDFVYIEGKEYKITGRKYQKDRVIIKLEGINSIDDVQYLREKFMEIDRENAVELEEDSYFLADLRECTVFDTTGKELGPIYDVLQTRHNDVYWIREPKELLIPVLKAIVLDIDIDNRKITIRPVGEWMDED